MNHKYLPDMVMMSVKRQKRNLVADLRILGKTNDRCRRPAAVERL